MTITDIVTNIDRRLVEARAELTQLQHARTALLDGARPALARPPRRRAPRLVSATPAKPTYQVVPVGKLTAVLAESEGMRTKELAGATGGDPTQVLALLKEQESAGEVRRSGTRASTRWHVVTDEDRIAARAAELASRSRQKSARRT
jgi:hypothetical protein